MGASDILKSLRGKGGGGNGAPPDKMAESDVMSRVIKLTDDEQKIFGDAAPGTELSCEVHGTLEADGSFRVASVAPMNMDEGADDSEQNMAGEVMQRVVPSMQTSPS